MATKKTAKTSATKAAAGDAAPDGSVNGFTAEERAAMRERAKELRAARNAGNEEEAVLEKLAAMTESDRRIGERLHALIRATAPELTPRLWYGMPAYAKNGKVLCFFQDAHKFKARYATLGFSDQANLDEGAMWPTSFAVKELDAAGEARIVELLTRAVR